MTAITMQHVPVFKPENLPRAMTKSQQRWATWGYDTNPDTGKLIKPPTNPRGGWMVSINKAWWSFEEARASVEAAQDDPAGFKIKPLGVGFLLTVAPGADGQVLKPHGLVAIDLDHAFDELDDMKDWAEEIVDRLAGHYIERSPSGNGLRIIGLAPAGVELVDLVHTDKVNDLGVELYTGTAARYVTMTGDILPESDPELHPFDAAELAWLVNKYENTKEVREVDLDVELPELLDDAELAFCNLAGLSEPARALLEDGEGRTGNRSRDLAALAVELCEITADTDGKVQPELVLSLLVASPACMEIALGHRRNIEALAIEYLWKHHVLKAAVLASPPLAGFDDILPDGTAARTDDERRQVAAEVERVRRYGSGPVRLDDFYAEGSSGKFIFRRNNAMWPATTIDKRFPKQQVGTDDKGKPIYAAPSTWLHQRRAVDQITWMPGEEFLVRNKLFVSGQLVDREGAVVYNMFSPSELGVGDSRGAKRWVDHVLRLYPDADGEHLLDWLAFKVQHPGRKVNHAIVMGGSQGIGKDSLLAPVVMALGQQNCAEVSPTQVLGTYTSWQQSVMLRISEARDLGQADRYRLYEATKTLIAAPPDVLRVEEKYMPQYSIPNVVGVIFTTNYAGAGGLYLPADDRRHFVIDSRINRNHLSTKYFDELWAYYEHGGYEDVHAWLLERDLSAFDPKAPPPVTSAKRTLVDAYLSDDDRLIDDLLSVLSRDQLNGAQVPAVTVPGLRNAASQVDQDGDELGDDLSVLGNGYKLAMCLERAGYVKAINPNDKRGRWKVGEGQANVYVLKELHGEAMRAAIRDL